MNRSQRRLRTRIRGNLRERERAAFHSHTCRIKHEEPHRLIVELFKERPMWNRIAIAAKTNLDDTMLKLLQSRKVSNRKHAACRILMAKYGFYILSGPWGRLWCKFGYDPRKMPDAKRYQTVMVSFRKHRNIPERVNRLRLVKQEAVASGTKADQIEYIYKPGMSARASERRVLNNMLRIHISGVMPSIRQMWYSVCDINLPKAQRLLRPDYYGTLKQYDAASGWLTAVCRARARCSRRYDRRVCRMRSMRSEKV